ncbi:MAG: c-type cytochrome [Deltaproteobacteria bacterium]|nr:c-type cytochrome [Deltaproteobacteria bacterium]
MAMPTTTPEPFSGTLAARWRVGFAVLALVVAGLVLAGFYKDQFREWKDWQQRFVEQEIARATTAEQREAAGRIPLELRQIHLPALERVDRCTSCHLGVEDPTYAGYPQPFAYHPNHDRHPFEKFGCTICHGGQGHATSAQAAHGHVPYWEEPLLSLKYVQSSCGKCHLASDVPEAEALAKGKRLFEDLGCRGCHRLGGEGNSIGPELDRVGRRRTPNWLLQHFRDPAKSTPGSLMPPLRVTDEEVEQLTVYMMSLTAEPLTEYYLSMKAIPGQELGRRLFEDKGCIGCHALGGKGGTVGPPLDHVAQRRSAEWIYAHFRDPQKVSPGTVMPRFGFSEHEARALTQFVLTLSDSELVGYLKIPALMTPEARGQQVYRKYGCAGCHGPEGKGGVPNPNAKTGGRVPSLLYVAEGYSASELNEFILRGQPEIAALDPAQPKPPLYMPAWRGKIAEGELTDLGAYLRSLLPQGEQVEF